jgi:hypothetical protein
MDVQYEKAPRYISIRDNGRITVVREEQQAKACSPTIWRCVGNSTVYKTVR